MSNIDLLQQLRALSMNPLIQFMNSLENINKDGLINQSPRRNSMVANMTMKSQRRHSTDFLNDAEIKLCHKTMPVDDTTMNEFHLITKSLQHHFFKAEQIAQFN